MQKKSWYHYLIELAIVVAGVTIAFWLGQLNEGRKERQRMETSMDQIRDEIRSNYAYTDSTYQSVLSMVETLEAQLTRSETDSSNLNIYFSLLNVSDAAMETSTAVGAFQTIDMAWLIAANEHYNGLEVAKSTQERVLTAMQTDLAEPEDLERLLQVSRFYQSVLQAILREKPPVYAELGIEPK